jgi:hypothetical protein
MKEERERERERAQVKGLEGFWTRAWNPRIPDLCLFSSPLLAIEPDDLDQRGWRHNYPPHTRSSNSLSTSNQEDERPLNVLRPKLRDKKAAHR